MLRLRSPLRTITCLSSPLTWKREILAGMHCYAFLNYSEKSSSTSQKIRPVSNTSAPHVSGSVNSKLPRGPNMIGNIRSIFQGFRIPRYVFVADLARAYRSVWTSYRSNIMRLILYPENPLDPSCASFVTIMMHRMTYSDQRPRSLK